MSLTLPRPPRSAKVPEGLKAHKRGTVLKQLNAPMQLTRDGRAGQAVRQLSFSQLREQHVSPAFSQETPLATPSATPGRGAGDRTFI